MVAQQRPRCASGLARCIERSCGALPNGSIRPLLIRKGMIPIRERFDLNACGSAAASRCASGLARCIERSCVAGRTCVTRSNLLADAISWPGMQPEYGFCKTVDYERATAINTNTDMLERLAIKAKPPRDFVTTP